MRLKQTANGLWDSKTNMMHKLYPLRALSLSTLQEGCGNQALTPGVGTLSPRSQTTRELTIENIKEREARQSQQKQDRELTVAQIMNSLLPNSDLN